MRARVCLNKRSSSGGCVFGHTVLSLVSEGAPSEPSRTLRQPVGCVEQRQVTAVKCLEEPLSFTTTGRL